MESTDLMVGQLAVAAMAIKTVISALKQVATISVRARQLLALGLGVLCGVALRTVLVEIPGQSEWAALVQHIISGLFIGAMAMGVHETITKPKAVE